MREIYLDPDAQVATEGDQEYGRRLPRLVLDRETIRNLIPTGLDVEDIGKKKTTTWPQCNDVTNAKPECPIVEPQGSPDTLK